MSSQFISAAWHARMTHVDGPEGLCVANGQAVRVLTAQSLDDVPGLIEQAHALAREGLYVVGGLSYEAAPAFDTSLAVQSGSQFPLLEFHAFDAAQVQFLSMDHVQPLVRDQSHQPWVDTQPYDEYAASFESIQRAIESGEFYQINLTTRLKARSTHVDAWALFQHLYLAQPAPQSVFLRGSAFNVISLSPELFFQWNGTELQTAPMKGTRRPVQGGFDVLSDSEKDRAENVMIVDLLRNDMAKVCKPRTVQVRSLFDVMHLPTVDQMTSSISGNTLAGTRLVDVFAALFPCGSVTGAPKSQAMLRIAQWEKGFRKFYCGALGVLSPGGAACFNVPIRTVIQQGSELEYGVGSGVTWYSTLLDEKKEWWQKTTFLREATASFQILETLRLEDGQWMNLDAHLKRVAHTANYFSYVFVERDVLAALARTADANPRGIYRARCLLSPDGEFLVELHVLELNNQPVSIRMADRCMNSPADFILHKTTYRPDYELFQKQADGAFDVLLFSAQGFLTETCRCNLVLKIDGEWVTPQICESTGTYLLPGVLRSRLLRENTIQQKQLNVQHLQHAEQVFLINSLRGWVPVCEILDSKGTVLFSDNKQ